MYDQSAYAAEMKPQPETQSPCEAAYSELREKQEVLASALAELTARLRPLLRDEAPTNSPGAQLKTVDSGPLSEVHGWLLASRSRTVEDIERVASLLRLLTV